MKAAAIGCAVSATLGLGLGLRITDTETHYRIKVIKIPQTHVVHDTKTVTRPLPASCLDAIKRLDEQSKPSGKITKATGVIKQMLSDLDKASFEKDVSTINSLILLTQEQKKIIDQGAIDLSVLSNDTKLALAVCKADISKGE